jgi:hypothetical protein
MRKNVRCSRNERARPREASSAETCSDVVILATQTEAYEKIVCELVERIPAHGKQSQVH